MTSHPLLLDGPGGTPRGSSEAYRALLERLYSLSRGGTKLGLERIAGLLAKLGHPERALPMVHVAGSNGKGSTSAFLAHILSVSGLRVGLFTSPHLVSLAERIQFVEGGVARTISQDELLRLADIVEAVEPGFGSVSFFEVVTALGLVAFREAELDVAVIEAGLGARLDSTRLVQAEVTVLTDLSLEHTAILGDTIQDIAREEGAVVRPRTPLVMADGPPEAMAVVSSMAEEAQAPVYKIGDSLVLETLDEERFHLHLEKMSVLEVKPSLLGPHQGRNALLAAQAAALLAPDLDAATIRRGLEATRWPGRMEIVKGPGSVPVLLDGAHNPHAARACAQALSADRFRGPRHFVFGVLRDKDVGQMLPELIPLASSFSLTRPASLRARAPEELVQMLTALGFEGPVEVAESPSLALHRALARAEATSGWVVACGSLYLVGDIRAELLGGG